MNTFIILGAGQFGRAALGLLNREHVKVLAFGDNNKRLWGSLIEGIPVMAVEQALTLAPDCLLIGVTDAERSAQLGRQAAGCGFNGRILRLGELASLFDIRSATLKRLAARLEERRVAGAVAELGVYRGDLAWKLNALFPKRRLYLFDTFDGFDRRDVAEEEQRGLSRAREGDFSDTSAETVIGRLPFPRQAVIRRGYFPQTAEGLEQEAFALVSLDADLYAPILAGLRFFLPRLNPGGMILLHDYNNPRYRGARQAVADYEADEGPLSLIPLCDLHGSAVLVRS